MGTGEVIMYIRQSFVLHLLRNHNLRKGITSTTFLVTVEMIQQTVLTDTEIIASEKNSPRFCIFAG